MKLALERWGPDVLGAPVKVAEVRISPRSGAGSLKGLEVGIPAGFAATRSARFGEVRVAIDPATITGDLVVIREIAIDAPIITLERGKEGNNLDAIQRNIAAYVRDAEPQRWWKPSDGKTAGRRFVVDRLTIRAAKVTMTNAGLRGQGVTFDLPDIQMHDIGRRQGGLRASEVADLVSREIIARIAQRVLTNVDLLRKGGVDGAIDALKGLFK